MKTGTRVQTAHGPGTVTDVSHGEVSVQLDKEIPGWGRHRGARIPIDDVRAIEFDTPKLEEHIRVLRELEADNQHSDWLVYYATHLTRDRRLARAAEGVLELHLYFGELTRPLREIRDKLYDSAKYLFEQRDPEGFKYARARGV